MTNSLIQTKCGTVYLLLANKLLQACIRT